MANIRFNPKLNKFFLDWYEDGRRRRLFTGSDEKHAQRELEKLNARLLMKKMGFPDPASSDTASDSKNKLPVIEVEAAIQKYLEYSQLHHSPKNYQGNAYVLNGPFLSFIKRKAIRYLAQVTPEVIENYKALRLKGESKIRKIKPISLNRQLNTIKPMFKKLAEWGYLANNPLERVASVKHVEEEKGCCLTHDESQKLLAASRQCNGGGFYYLVATAIGTGMRKSELENLKTTDLDLEKKEIRIINRGQNARTKTGKNRIVDLSDPLARILSKHQSHNEHVFDFTNFRRNWAKTKKLSGINCRFHDLRHTFITHCLQNGIQPISVADWVGHTDLRMIMKIYKHLQRHHLKKEINKLDTLFDSKQA